MYRKNLASRDVWLFLYGKVVDVMGGIVQQNWESTGVLVPIVSIYLPPQPAVYTETLLWKSAGFQVFQFVRRRREGWSLVLISSCLYATQFRSK